VTTPPTDPVLLELRDLRTSFDGDAGVARAVDGVSLRIGVGETLALVGESGCGKSVTGLSILRLVPSPPGRIDGGAVLFRGEDLLRCSLERMRQVRGNEIAMIFQDPMTALNPVRTVGAQIVESLRLHAGLDRRAARARAIELLTRVGIAGPKRRIDEYPHALSGGMRQRVMIAMAMACGPSLLIADEPTTALDVTIQAQILGLIRELKQRDGTSVLLITHDLGVVAETADRVAVMYAGRLCEEAPLAELFERPQHPYTIGLFQCLPGLRSRHEPLVPIPGTVPSADRWPSGCRFRTRCPIATQRCAVEDPELSVRSSHGGHRVACHHVDRAIELRAPSS